MSDDILVRRNTLEEHNENSKNIFKRIHTNGLRINPAKCTFAVQKLTFAGHIIFSNVISPNPAKISAINNIKEPSNITEVKSLLGMINYCNCFIPTPI